MSGRNLKLSGQANLNKKRVHPLKLLKNPLTSNVRGDSSRQEIEPKLAPVIFRTPATVIKIKSRRKRGVRPPFAQQADNLVAKHSPQQRVGVDTGLTPFDPGERMKQPTLPLVSRVRLKSLSHSVADVGTNSEKSASFPRHQEEIGAGVKLFPRLVPPQEGRGLEGVIKAGVKTSPRFEPPREGGEPEEVTRAGVKLSPRFVPPPERGGPEGVTKAGVKSFPRFVPPHEGGGPEGVTKAGVKPSPRFVRGGRKE